MNRNRMAPITKIVLILMISQVMSFAQDSPAEHTSGGPPPSLDFSKIEIQTVQVSVNFYALRGGPGSTIGVLTGGDGVFLVDSNYAELGKKNVAAIRKLTDRPILYLVDTHVHPDHVSSNEMFHNLGAVVIARNELRQRMAEGFVSPGDDVYRPPARPGALPTLTYEGSLTIHLDGQDAEIIAVPHAHTDGDSYVRFPKEDILMTGDVFRTYGYPGADVRNRGSMIGIIEGLKLAISLTGPNTKVIPGHGQFSDRHGLEAELAMVTAARVRVSEMMREGKTEQEILAAHLTGDWDPHVPEPQQAADRFIRQIYMELQVRPQP